MSGRWYRPTVVAYCTNFGYLYCTKHGTEYGVKCDKPHVAELEVRDGGGTCEWPGCGITIPEPSMELVDPPLAVEVERQKRIDYANRPWNDKLREQGKL